MNLLLGTLPMKKFTDLINDCLPAIEEIFPWDLEEKLNAKDNILLIDIREPYEYDDMHIEGSINIPRGVLETACDWGYDNTLPELAAARDKEVVVICRSGNRSVLAAYTMKLMGYQKPVSLKTGVAGWNDSELPLVDNEGNTVDIDVADEVLHPEVSPEQLAPE